MCVLNSKNRLDRSQISTSKIRPIGAGEVIIKIAQKAMAAKEMPAIARQFTPLKQLGVAVKRGTEAAAHAVQHIWDKLAEGSDDLDCRQEEIYVATTDLAQAYQNIDQGTILNEVALRLPRLFKLTAFMFARPIKMNYNGNVILSQQGVTQGSVFGCETAAGGFAGGTGSLSGVAEVGGT